MGNLTKYLCTCSRCVSKTCTGPDGKILQGQFQSRRTQLSHHQNDIPAIELLQLRASRWTSARDDDDNDSDSVTSKADSDYHHDDSIPTVIALISIFLAWLHLFCGISHINCQKARRFLLRITGIVQSENQTEEQDDYTRIPKDIRTILKRLAVIPELHEQICCPTCFLLYSPAEAPQKCTYRKAPKARECGEDLFTIKTMYQSIRDTGKSSSMKPSHMLTRPPCEIGIPRNVYVTQSLSSWLKWFLSQSSIEDDMAKWSEELNQSADPKVNDIQRSAAWADISWPSEPEPNASPPALNLVVSIFINWFNPRGNKTSGSQQSMGVLAFNCLNLRPSLRNLTRNTCVTGITPGPNAPDMDTISHILKGIVDELLNLELGINIATSKFPDGRLVRVKLLCVLGDLVGMHKVCGYASHSATFYCSWCWAKQLEIGLLKLSKTRLKKEVEETSFRSKGIATLSGKDDILRETGIRWSELNRLTYRDPVKHLPLGMMHNWFEGVLHQHFRFRWGFVIYNTRQKGEQKRNKRDKDRDEDRSRPKKRVMYEEGGGNLYEDKDDEWDDEEDHEDVQLEAGLKGGLLSLSDIQLFQSRMRDVVIPTGITRLPLNLGETKHGKLKAAQWHSLFAYVIPLIILELYVTDPEEIPADSNRRHIIFNIGYLTQCTNIVCAKSVSEADASHFESLYKKYTLSSKKIFENVVIKPNHHYALHIPEQMRFWGPLGQVAEFAGERLIGVLQNVQSNMHLREMDRTMMRRFCQLQRLMGDHPIVEEISLGDDSGPLKSGSQEK